MLSINTNNASMAAVNAISKSSSSLSTSMERLATGNRINSSADDAAGKQIANRLTAQSSGMGVALSNNRLNDTANNLTSMQDNTEVAIGNIMDTDYATEASNMTKQQVLMQTGITMLKQSNSMSSMVSSLLQ
ncbi:flagellin [Escherichia coli]|uniref:flagellin n=1 Tax=Escherichia coli TaxID=562 RepID=UPI001BFC8021|nr:flagellin [Escherichia coli]